MRFLLFLMFFIGLTMPMSAGACTLDLDFSADKEAQYQRYPIIVRAKIDKISGQEPDSKIEQLYQLAVEKVWKGRDVPAYLSIQELRGSQDVLDNCGDMYERLETGVSYVFYLTEAKETNRLLDVTKTATANRRVFRASDFPALIEWLDAQ